MPASFCHPGAHGRAGQGPAVHFPSPSYCQDRRAAPRYSAMHELVLEIAEIAGRTRCQSCQTEFAVDQWMAFCPCGGIDMDVIAGHKLRVKNMELV